MERGTEAENQAVEARVGVATRSSPKPVNHSHAEQWTDSWTEAKLKQAINQLSKDLMHAMTSAVKAPQKKTLHNVGNRKCPS